LSEARRKEALRRLDALTPRERQVLALVAAGKPNKGIAAELGTSERTVKLHRGQVMRKMGAESLPELVVLAQEAGILPASPTLPPGTR
jgi:FixJ family two-component response regulator